MGCSDGAVPWHGDSHTVMLLGASPSKSIARDMAGSSAETTEGIAETSSYLALLRSCSRNNLQPESVVMPGLAVGSAA